MFRRHLGAEVALSDSAAARLEDALGQARTLEAHELMALVGVTCLVTDARNLDLPPGSVDAFVSNNTLEHIPVDVIAAIFQEFHRLGTPDCIMSHYIDLADHYVGFDGNIGVLNFLQYSERRWRWYNNDLQYQNRLRVNEYRAIHERNGWQVVREESTSADVSELRKLRLAPEFRGRREEDLVVYQSWMVSKPVRP
jgi:SAM-dependent methyltransferase